MTTRDIVLEKSGEILIPEATWCDSYMTKLRGFTFRKTVAESDGLVLVEGQDGRIATAIHMLFVNFDLAVIWVNNAGEVVDKVLAKPWRLSYAPKAPARYVIEGHPIILNQVEIGDTVRFIHPNLPPN